VYTGTRRFDGAVAAAAVAQAERSATLRGRRLAARRRRLALHVRDWFGITLIACFSLTLFAVTFFSLVGR
jgi:hypothetical protein